MISVVAVAVVMSVVTDDDCSGDNRECNDDDDGDVTKMNVVGVTISVMNSYAFASNQNTSVTYHCLILFGVQ